MKKIDFIPGFTEHPSDYRALSKYLNIVNIDWNKPKVRLKKPKVLCSFSLGGFLALEYALKNKVETLVLCSLTPGIETLKKIKTDRVIFIVGGKEKWVLKEVRRVSKTLRCPYEIIVVHGADHKIAGNYRKKLLKILANI